ncbi:MAG: hypothetical protein ACREP2_08445 [Rhodanobacteraceae bacterium]
MPRNEAQKTTQPPPRGRIGALAGTDELSALGAPVYVRLTQRQRPPRDRRSTWVLVAVVVAAHALLAWIAYLVLRPEPHHPGEQNVVQITLIEPTSGLPPPPSLIPPPPLQRAAPQTAPHRPVPYVPPAKGAISVTLEGPKGQPLDLYAPNGQIRLPPPSSSQKTAPPAAYRTPEIQGSQLYSGKSPVPYKPTRFAKDFAPTNQSLGAKTIGRAFDKAVEKTTVVKTVKLPGGIKVKCGVSPLLLALGCLPPPPPPPPKNDNDIRLSMPPPETLTGKKVAVPSSAASAPKPATAASTPASASSS